MKLDRIGNTPDAADKYMKAAATLNEAAALCTISKASVAAADCAKAAENFAASVFPDSAAKAIVLYRQAAKQLSEAAACCPPGHRDREALAAHVSEIEVRVVYLESLNGAPTTVPIENHIGTITLQLDPPAFYTESEEPDVSKECVALGRVGTSAGDMDAAKVAEPQPAEGPPVVLAAPAPVPADLAVARVDYLQSAVDLERKAQEFESVGQLEPALGKFTQCLELFAFVQKREQNPRVKQTVRDRMAAILDRAEVIKARVQLGGRGA